MTYIKKDYWKNMINSAFKIFTVLFFSISFVFAEAQSNISPPKLSGPDSYTWILLPDLQTYQKFGRNQAIFDLMVGWIKDQKKQLNIQLVLCVGDLVEQNNILVPDGINGDQTSLEQWNSVSASFAKLDGEIPYILCTGNHDYGFQNAENRYSHFNSYFHPLWNNLSVDFLVEMAPNALGVPTLENACFEWKSPLNQDFLIFSIEFAPRDEILAWTKEIASKEKYKNHIGVILTHSYLNSEGKHIVRERYPLENANYGETIWRELIRPLSNIQFVFSGHVASSDGHQGQVAYRTDVNSTGESVHQILFNAQREGGGWHGNGGNGWLRILEFLPDRKTLIVKTFSPLFHISPETRHLSWRNESFDKFNLTY
jgi:predicted MPP superfamily phosphohydrolase